MPPEWREEYNLGIADLDRQHREFFHLLNRISESSERGDISREEVISLLAGLRDHVMEHLECEEEYFGSFEYPGAARHIDAHNHLRTRLADYFSRTVPRDANHAELAADMARFTKEWFEKHIIEMDRELVLLADKKTNSHAPGSDAA